MELKNNTELKNNMILVRINKLPPGYWPDDISSVWPGLEVLVGNNIYPGIIFPRGLGKGSIVSGGIYAAPMESALRVLEEKSPKAAQWYRKQKKADFLNFPVRCVTILPEPQVTTKFSSN
jgi:hypothetical protein